MLLRISQRIPICQTFVFYPLQYHFIALKKFAILWLASLLPLFLAATFAKAPTNTSLLSAISSNLKVSFLGTDPFIYAVSFITPIFLLYHERYKSYQDHSFSRKRSTKDLKQTPPGLHFLIVISSIIFSFCALAYAHSKTAHLRTYPTIFEQIFAYSSIWVYFYSLLCWYLVILDGCDPIITDFTKETRDAENQMKSAFKDRVRKGNKE